MPLRRPKPRRCAVARHSSKKASPGRGATSSMSWAIELSREAQKDLEGFPKNIRDRLVRAFDDMEDDPFRSNVKLLKGSQWEGRYRKKVGPYRIIFMADRKNRKVEVSTIVIRSKGTYR